MFVKNNYYQLKQNLKYDWCHGFGNPKKVIFIIQCTKVSWRLKTISGFVVESNLVNVFDLLDVSIGTYDEWDMDLFEELSIIEYKRDFKLKELGL